MELTMSRRHAVTKKIAAAYPRATKSEKSLILDSLVELTGWPCDCDRHGLKGAGTIKLVQPRRARAALSGAPDARPSTRVDPQPLPGGQAGSPRCSRRS